MELRCAGCQDKVSEWAARCPRCGHALDDAELVAGSATSAERSHPRPVVAPRDAVEVTDGELVIDPPPRSEPQRAGWSSSRRALVLAIAFVTAVGVIAGAVALSRPGPVARKPSSGPVPAGKKPTRQHTAPHHAASRPAVGQLPSDLASERLFFAEPSQTGLYRANGAVVTELVGTAGVGDEPLVSGRGLVVYVHGHDAYRTAATSARPVNLGPASWVFPAEHGAIGIESGGNGKPASVEYMAADGTIPAPGTTTIQLPPEVTAIAQVPSGLLVASGALWAEYPYPVSHFRLSIIEPPTRVSLGAATALIGTHGASVAWITCRSSRCSLHILNTTTGDARILRPPAGYTGYAQGGEFSPDGSLLATFVPSNSPSGRTEIRLVVVRVATGTASIVGPPLFAGPTQLGAATWSSDGYWLYFGGLTGTLDAEHVTDIGPQGNPWTLPLPTSFAVAGD